MRRNDDFYRTLFEAAADPIVLLTEDGRFIEANYNALALFGCDRDSLIDRNLTQFMAETQPDGRTSAAVLPELLAAGQESWHEAELLCLTADQQSFIARITLYSVVTGDARYLQGSLQDITGIKASEERYRTIVENIQDGFYEVDLQGNHTFVNQAFCEIVGHTQQALIGINYRSYIAESTAAKLRDAFSQVFETGQANPGIDYEIKASTSERKIVQTSISLIKDGAGQATGFRGIIRDVTARKEIEDNLAQSRLRLEANAEAHTTSVLEANADLLTEMVERIAVEEELERRNRILENLTLLSREASFEEDLSPILDKITQFTGEVLGVTSVYLSTWDQEARTTAVISEFVGPEANEKERVSDKGVVYDLEETFGMSADRLNQLKAHYILYVDDPDLTLGERNHFEEYGNITELGVPLIARGAPIGMLEVWDSRSKRLFTDEEIEMAIAIGRQVAATFDNARLFQQAVATQKELAARAESLQITNRIADTLYSAREMATVVEEALDAIVGYANAPSAAFYQLDAEAGMLNLLSSRGFSADTVKKGATLPVQGSLSGITVARKEIVTVANLLADDRLDPDVKGSLVAQNLKNIVSVPLLFQSQVMGVINLVFDQPVQLQDQERETLLAVGKTVALAMSNAQYLERIEREIAEREMAESGLRESEDRFQALASNAPSAIYQSLNDRKFTMLYMSNAIELITGYPAEEFTSGRLSITDLYPPDVTIQPESPEILKENGAYQVSYRLKHRSGEYRWIDDIGAPVFDAEGDLLYLVGFLNDVTERKAAEDAIRAQEEQAVFFQEKLQALQEVGLELSRVADLDELYRRSIKLGMEKLGFDRIGLLLFDEAANELVGTYGVDVEGNLSDERTLRDSIPPDVMEVLHRRLRLHLREDIDLNQGGEIVGHGWNALTGLWDGDKGVGWLSIDNLMNQAEPSPQLMDLFVLFANTVGSLITRKRTEQAIEESLAQRSRQIQISTQVAQEIAQAPSLDELYGSVVRLVKEEFGYYHVQLLRYDPLLDSVALVVGYGETGQAMLDQGHKMPLGVGIIGSAAATGESILRPSLANDPDWRPNPLLPETQGELAVPIKFGDELLGMLDVQSRTADALNADDQLVLQGLCGQVAIAIESTRLREEMGRSIEELNIIQQQMSREGWQMYRETRGQLPGYQFDMIGAQPVETAVIRPTNGKQTRPAKGTASLAVRGAKLATLVVEDDPERPLSLEDEALIAAVSSQIAEALEAARLFEQTQDSLAEQERLASELETVAEVSTVAATILEIDNLLQSVVDLAKTSFNLYHAHVYLTNSNTTHLELKAGADTVGRLMTLEGREIRLTENSLIARAARTRQGVMVDDVRQTPDFLPHPLLPDTRSELAVPMIVGDEVIGVLDLQSARVNQFTVESLQIYRTLASQVAVAVQNARLYAEQVAATEKLREVDRLKSEFLASMSHELRTPLNSIIGFADVLLEGLDGPLNERMEEDVRLIRDSGRHLRELIGDILDMSKIEAGRMDLRYEKVDMRQMANDIVATAAPLAQEKNLYLKTDLDEGVSVVEADRTRIRQILWNITGNAIKFTQKGGVTISMKEKESDLLIGIHDTGIGIQAEDIAIVFEQFRQIDGSLNRSVGGTGLGMPITRNLVELHGGQIWIESTMGVGTIFWFTIPILKSLPRIGTGPLG